jgi:hypothetical protein
MGSLSGSKIKDTFGLLLKMASSTVSASEQLVQDGEGNNTALKLSTDTVESTGDFKCTGTMASSTTDVQALMLSSTGVFVKRNLSTNPIGTSSVTANSPLSATGSTIGVLPAGSLSPLTEETAVNADKLLIWDESASAYKYITLVELSDYVVNTGATVVPTMFVAKPQATTSLSSGATTMIGMAELYSASATGAVSAATSSIAFGGATSSISFVDAGGVRNNIRLSVESMYQVQCSVEFTIAAGTPIFSSQLYINDGASSVVLINNTHENPAGTHTMYLSAFFYADSSVPYDLALRCFVTGAGSVVVTKNTSLSITNLGQISLPA